jgi:glutathione synthase/RimK-type ligase-like ATP-grasp enzyme
MTRSPSQRIGIITSGPAKLADYFPTTAEPDFIPVEPPFTPDDQMLVNELRHRGHHVSAVVWGMESAALVNQYDLLIVRSPWDYMDNDDLRRTFLHWLENLATTGIIVENEVPVMLWLMDKHYLLDFVKAGLPIVPTQLIAPGQSFDLASFFEQHGPTVIKPAVSAGGAGLEFLPDRAAVREFQPEFADRCRRGAHLVQPFLPEIQTHGEWSLVYFGGHYSHGVHKLPGRGQIMVHAERGGSLAFAEPPTIVREMGDRAAAAVPNAFAQHSGHPCSMPLYLRIDIIETAAGALLSECEGVEPELFFRARPESVALFASFIESRSLTRPRGHV